VSIDRHRGGPFPNLDAFRGIGSVMIITFHVAFASGMRIKSEYFNRYLARLDVAIPIFFLLSGFLLFRPFAAALIGQRPWPSIRGYARNRALRILPVYWLAMVTVMLWFGVPKVDAGPFSVHPWGGIAYYALMLQTFGAQYFTGFDQFNQAWSIGTEVTFYLALPLAAFGCRRFCRDRDPAAVRRLLLVGCGVLWVVAQLWRTGMAGLDPSWAPSAAFWLPAHLDFFGFGIALATLHVGVASGLPLPRWLTNLGDAPWRSWTIALVLWLVSVDALGLFPLFRIHVSPVDFSSEYVAKMLVYGLVAFFAVVPAIVGPQRVGPLRAVLGSRPMVALGVVSLGTYLWHKAWLSQAERWTDAAPFGGSFVRLWLITMAGGIASGALCHWLIERPLLARKARHVVTARPDPVAA
jgi:peptidoglycan/LPS O-acetylase OafA/YrhL